MKTRDELLSALRQRDAVRETDSIEFQTVDRIVPQMEADWPEQLHSKITEVLRSAGFTNPYPHQAATIRNSLQGNDVVLEAPTASGKTLAFIAPMLDAIVRDPGARGMLVYPMKALAFDQREQIRRLCEPLGIESWPYDADTDEKHRELLRGNPPDLLLTNPEYLNMSFLGSRSSWEEFLRSLKYIVVDEMHEYRGYFGGNFALVLRRFLLHLHRLGAAPRLILSSATCANPVEHARNLTGREPISVSSEGAFRPRRHFVFVNPDIPDYQYRDLIRHRIENAALSILESGLTALVFCPTKRFLEDAFRNARGRAQDEGLDPDQIAAFHADLKIDQRQRIQQAVRSGQVRIVFTTNALELGVDIGSLDGVVMAGFPPSVMSAWQQIGRAGRSWDSDAFVLTFAMNDPIDKFFGNNLDAFLDRRLDELVVDLNNEQVISNHLAATLQETGADLSVEEEQILGSGLYDAVTNATGMPPRNDRPQMRIDLRGGFGQSYDLRIANETIGRISEFRRFREAYLGAILTFYGSKYRVHAHEADAIVLREAEPHLRTDASFYTTLTPGLTIDGRGWDGFETYYTTLTSYTNFTGYMMVDERTNEEDFRPASEALPRRNLHAFTLDLTAMPGSREGLGAVEHMLRVGAMFVIPADRFDTSTHSTVADVPTAYYHENYSGGIGIAKKMFERWTEALAKGLEIAASCPCRDGCQNCIQPAKSYDMSGTPIDKEVGLELARTILDVASRGHTHQFRDGLMIPV